MRFNLRAKLLLSFGLLLLLFGVVGYNELRHVESLSQTTQKLLKHPLTVTRAVLKANSGILTMHRSMKDVVLSRDDDELTRAIAIVSKTEKSVLENYDEIQKWILGKEGARLAANARDAFLGWRSIRSEVISLMKDGNTEEAVAITKGKGADHVKLLTENHTALWEYAKHKAEELEKNATGEVDETQRHLIISMILSLIIGVAMSLFISMSISKRVGKLRNAVSSLADGDMDQHVTITGGDEIADLGASFNIMANNLAEASAALQIKSGELAKMNEELENRVEKRTTELNFTNESLRKEIFERKKIAEALLRQTGDLGERVKELNCLYSISKVIERPEISTKDIFQEVANIIPPSWQYPEITCARIRIGVEVYTTENFRETTWRQVSNIFVQGERIGRVEVFYLKEMPEMGEGPFLREERHLIDEISSSLARVTERKRVEEELKDFAYVVSHDLKTPLRAIHNYSDFLMEDLKGKLEGEQKTYLDNLGKAVRQSEEFINDLLIFARISRQEISFQNQSIGKYLRELIDKMDLEADVKIVMGNDWPDIDVEPTLFYQIFSNLINNAVKFNKSAEKVLELGRQIKDNGYYDIFIRDNGIGIDSRFFDRIFKPFQRLHTSKEYEGTGIGLAIVMKAVSRLGGKVRIDSKPGEGSTFFVTLPKSQKEEK